MIKKFTHIIVHVCYKSLYMIPHDDNINCAIVIIILNINPKNRLYEKKSIED